MPGLPEQFLQHLSGLLNLYSITDPVGGIKSQRTTEVFMLSANASDELDLIMNEILKICMYSIIDFIADESCE